MTKTLLEYKVFNVGKQKHAAEFMKKCEAIIKFITVNCNHGGPTMFMVIKKIQKAIINRPYVLVSHI